jgi:uncharacterized repeat protein (TIGR03803 family)
MKKSLLTLALTFAAITFSLAARAQAQTITYLAGQGISAPVNPSMFIQATDGNFYSEGQSGFQPNGYIYRMTPSGAITIIHSFCAQSGCADGDQPQPPILGSDGNLYGVTTAGGNSSLAGTFYKLTLSGEFTQLYSFCPNSGCADGRIPNGIVEGPDGNFYGTARAGGGGNVNGGAGTIFSISPTGQFKVLYTFCSQANCADGQQPPSTPIVGDDGNFYGVAQFGGTGTGAPGVAYKLTPSGEYSVIYNFCSALHCIDGAQPLSVTQGPHSTLFGITSTGGTNFCGTAFRIGPNNSYQVLRRFSGADMCNPFDALTLANDGNFYDVSGTYSGGGLIFQLTPEGGFTSLYDFACCHRAYDPAGMLFQATDGNLYGTTLYNGEPCCTGAIFKFSNGLSPLVQTVPNAGKVGKQIIILGNNLTGTSSVKFNGVEAAFTVESDTYIQATVPAGASTGKVSVVTSSGTLNSNPQFIVTK